MLRVDVSRTGAQATAPPRRVHPEVCRTQASRDLDEIAALLGLQRDQVVSTVADQISSNNLTRTSDGQLASRRWALRRLAISRRCSQCSTQLNVPFDRLVWNAQDYARASLIKKRDAQEAGLEILPAKKSSRVDLNDLTVERFNELVESRDDRTRKLEVLRVRKIASQNLHLYMPAQLLVYGDPESGEVELGLCVEGDLQPAHGLELAAADAVVKLGIAVARPEPRPTLPPSSRSSGLLAIRSRSSGRPGEQVPKGDDEPAEKAKRVEDIAVRSVDVHEHAQLLAKALNGAKSGC